MSDLPSTIRHPEAFQRASMPWFDGVFDWSFLLKPTNVFPRGITPMDFDMVVDVGENWLIGEAKDLGVPVPDGQFMCLQRLSERLRERVVVLFMWGQPPSQWAVMINGVTSNPGPCDVDLLRRFAASWVKYPAEPINWVYR